MKCAFCKNGDTKLDAVTVTLQRDDTTIIIKEVPADVCENCGEYYLSDENTDKVLRMAEDAVHKGVEVEIMRFSVDSFVNV